MEFFKCCKECVPPKRHSGCHSKCKEYQKDKKLLDERNAQILKEKKQDPLNKKRVWLSRSRWY